jgi:hypothetical protein
MLSAVSFQSELANASSKQDTADMDCIKLNMKALYHFDAVGQQKSSGLSIAYLTSSCLLNWRQAK